MPPFFWDYVYRCTKSVPLYDTGDWVCYNPILVLFLTQIVCVCVCVRARRLGPDMTSDIANRYLEPYANLLCSSDTEFIYEECQTVYKRQVTMTPL